MRIAVPEVEHSFELRALLHEHCDHVELPRRIPSAPPTHRWLLSSAMQKCIRRGHVKHAVRYAIGLHVLSPDNAWRRLAVVALEDIGFGNLLGAAMVVEAARSIRFRQQCGELRAVAACAAALASSTKSRSIVDHVCAGRTPTSTIHSNRIAEPSRFQEAEQPFLLRFLARAGRQLEGLGNHLLPAYQLLKDADLTVKRFEPDTAGDEMIGLYPAAALDYHCREGRAAMLRFAALPPIAEFFADHPDLDRLQALYLAIWSVESVRVDRALAGLEVAALELEGVLMDWAKIGVRDSTVAVRLKSLVREHRAQLNYARSRIAG